MSKVKLIVKAWNSLDFGEVKDLEIRLPENVRVAGVIRSDFDPEPNGEVRGNDQLDPVVTTENINHLVGKIMTIIEVSVSDPEQRKASKDLYMQTIWSWYGYLNDDLSRAWRFDKGYESDVATK